MDTITVKNLKVFACHGVNDFEKTDGQFFYIDIEARVDLSKAGLSDNLEDTVSYAKIAKTAISAFTAQADNLLERAAQRVADALFESFDKITGLVIEVKKPDAPIKADFEYVSVRIERERL
jgi:dihydroneopterin aldolase